VGVRRRILELRGLEQVEARREKLLLVELEAVGARRQVLRLVAVVVQDHERIDVEARCKRERPEHRQVLRVEHLQLLRASPDVSADQTASIRREHG
jgi:hypothetical protein